jgi:acyl-CoA thioester hydrolase
MQEAAFDASAAAGYGMARYEAMGRHWLARETDVEYLRPLRYGDTVEVKTWVADFRRVRSRRAYELRLVGSEELVARGHTDWVFLETATGRPVSIPAQMMTSFFPEGPPKQAPPRSRFPSKSLPSQGVFRQRRRAEWRDIDTAQHVNNAVYVDYIEDCELQAAAACGWTRERMQAEGFDVAVRRHRIEYRQPAVLDDQLESATWVSDVGGASATRHYTVSRMSDGVLLARAITVWETMSAETGQTVPIPEAFLADLAPNITGRRSSL